MVQNRVKRVMAQHATAEGQEHDDSEEEETEDKPTSHHHTKKTIRSKETFLVQTQCETCDEQTKAQTGCETCDEQMQA